jgi:hypothetical protein
VRDDLLELVGVGEYGIAVVGAVERADVDDAFLDRAEAAFRESSDYARAVGLRAIAGAAPRSSRT